MVLKSRTLFVIGAGASFEIGLPIGKDLKADIGRRVNIQFSDGYNQSSGDQQLTEALREVVRLPDGRRGDINPLLHKAWQMSAALPQAISIDNYVDAREDEQIAEIGKLAIVRAIAEGERTSRLFLDRDGRSSKILNAVSDTHYHLLFQLLSEGLHTSSAGSIFERVGVVSFNYDRSLEWYFVNSIANYFAIPEQQARQIVSTLQIVHPYGTLGPLPGVNESGARVVPYGGSLRPTELVQAARSIRTFSEQIADLEVVQRIETQVTIAEHIVFLGFGYHDMNMRTLATAKKTSLRRVFGTALGVSKSDIEAVGQTIRSAFQGVGPNRFADRPDIQLRADLKCTGIFEEYGRSLRA